MTNHSNFKPLNNIIYLGTSITSIRPDAFSGYGSSSLILKVPYSPDAGENCHYNNPEGLSASNIGVSRILLIGEDLV